LPNPDSLPRPDSLPADPNSLPADPNSPPADPNSPAGPVTLPSPDWLPDPDSPPAAPNSPTGPGALPVGPVKMLGPITLPAGVDSLTAGPNDLPDAPDVPVPAAVFLGVMLKALTLPVEPPPLPPVPPPAVDLAEPNCVVVVVEWRVIVVADSCIGPTPSGALGVEKGLPGAFGPWCVFASAVPAADKATHIAAAVTAPVITTLRVQGRCGMLCLPTMSPPCNKYLEYAAQFWSDYSPQGLQIYCKK
jgi:hypothetical protein